MFGEIIHFWQLNFIAIWLDMVKSLIIFIVFTIGRHVICEDYLQQATQRGLDYGTLKS
jgi:hypothetical protein